MVDDLKRTGALGPKDETTVLIKPDTTSTYSDLVNMLDEMNINDIKVYAIVDITELEQGWIKATEDGSAGATARLSLNKVLVCSYIVSVINGRG